MGWLILQFVLLAAVIAVAGSFLARYADALGEVLGINRSLAGIILLAVGTSLPELAIDVHAVRMSAPDLAVGDLLGSCLFNLLILAVLDCVQRSNQRMLSREAAAHALSSVACMLLTSVALAAIVLREPLVLGRMGAGTVAIGMIYLLSLRMIYFDQQSQRKQLTDETRAPDQPDSTQRTSMTRRRAALGYAGCSAAIFAAAPYLARVAEQLAEQSGLGQSFVGTLLVALTTSLPEVSSTLAAVRMGAFDLAVGNIFGSNACNMLILALIDPFSGTPLLGSVLPSHAVTAAAVIAVTAVATMGILYQAERRLWLVEYDAALVIALVLGALWLVYWLSAR